MKAITRTTYHFQRDPGGDQPDEGSIRRGIEELINLLWLRNAVETTAAGKAVNAMTEGFTLEQYFLFKIAVGNEIEARRNRHATADNGFSKAVLEQVDAIEKRALKLFQLIDGLVAGAEKYVQTGLEPTAAQRREAEGVAP